MMVSVDVKETWVARYYLINKSYYVDPRDHGWDNRESKTFLNQNDCDEWVSENTNLCKTLEIIHTKEIK